MKSPFLPTRMRLIDPALAKAFALSLLLHALLFAAAGGLDQPLRGAFRAHRALLEVTLQPPETSAELQPLAYESTRLPTPIRLPRKPPARSPDAADGVRLAVVADSGLPLEGDAAQQANAQLARELLYPPEAIARGLEGQALVLLFLDASGNAIAARLEASSGHALLDDAAVRAARTLHALPASAPREALLPVRFRLR